MKQALRPPPGMQPRIAALICVVLEDVTTKDLRIGFVAGSLDGRGVWTRSPEEGGHQEELWPRNIEPGPHPSRSGFHT